MISGKNLWVDIRAGPEDTEFVTPESFGEERVGEAAVDRPEQYSRHGERPRSGADYGLLHATTKEPGGSFSGIASLNWKDENRCLVNFPAFLRITVAGLRENAS